MILRLLAMLTANRPRSVDDIKDRVSKTFPTPIDTWALTEAQGGDSIDIFFIPEPVLPQVMFAVLG